MDTTLRALDRFGLGARLGEPGTIADPKAWLRGQLRADATLDGPELEELGEAFAALRAAQRSQDRDALAAARRSNQEIVGREVDALLDRRLSTDAPYLERLVAFWSNHLCVSAAAGPQVALLAGHYERSVVRPHVLGRFADMVLASVKHPAMLFYLNNAQSIGPNSTVGRMAGRRGRGGNARGGLNENHARELLELHTVGVDGGYDQEDVVELAKVLTGWTVGGLAPDGAMAARLRGRRGRGGAGGGEERFGTLFREAQHEPGPKTVLGRRYDGGAGEIERVVRDLCAHPSTARFVATKLVTHFVSDDPPARAVDAVAGTFADSGGDLRAVADTLVDLPEAWDPEAAKFRSPLDWLTAVFRAFRVEDAPEMAGPVLRQLRWPTWAPPSPKGFGDTASDWADPDSLMNRAELARSVAREAGRGQGRRAGATPAGLDPRALLEVVEPTRAGPLEQMLGDDSIDAAERIALAIGGPAFQWR